MSTISPPGARRLRLPLALLGIVAFALGIASIVAPTIAAVVPIAEIRDFFGTHYDFILLAILAGVAAFVVVGLVVVRGVTGLNQTTPPRPEEVHSVPTFGAEFDEILSGGRLRTMLRTNHHGDVRSRLREAAITTVMREAGCTRSEALDRVERGTWTDDADAATFLAEPAKREGPTGADGGRRPAGTSGPRATGPGGDGHHRESDSAHRESDSAPGFVARLTSSLRGETPFQRGARRTAVEIVRRDPEVDR